MTTDQARPVPAPSPPAGGFFHHARTGRAVPWQIWVVALLLGLEGIGNLLEMSVNLLAARWLAFKVVSVVGLIRGWRWVYVVTLISGALHVLGFASINLITAGLNLVLVMLVASTSRYFSPRPGDPVIMGDFRPGVEPIAHDLEF